MTIKTTRFSPDTCGCVLEYEWDDTLSEASRVHTFKSITKCPAHSAQADQTAYNTVFDENPRKNIALQTALDNGPNTLYDMNGTQRVLKPAVGYNYSWSGTAPDRVLSISFTGVSLTTTQKNTIRNAINTRLGNGKVTLL
jgi:hypothetical protein